MKSTVASQLEQLQPELRSRAHTLTEALRPFADEINAAYNRECPPGRSTGQAVVVLTAGVPGAGKSMLIDSLEDRDTYRNIDPDIFKNLCLRVAEREGMLDDWLGRTLADGKPIHRGELSSLVHTYSTALADQLEDRCFAISESFIRQGTFTWLGLPSQYVNQLEELGGYKGYQIIAVEAGRRQALDQAASRWWDARTQGSPETRYLPPAAINDLYATPNTTYSRSLANAVDLINRPESGDFTLAKLTLLDRVDPKQEVTKSYQHDPDHELTVETIERDVANARGSTADQLLKRVQDLNTQADRIDDPDPSIDHDPTPHRPIDPPENHITP